MKLLRCKVTTRAFGRADLIIIVGTIVLLAIVLAWFSSALSRGRQRGPHPPTCTRNLRQVGLAFRIFANEHDEWYPFAAPNLTNAHTGVLLTSNVTTAKVWMHFQALSNELQCALVLRCPQDTNRWKTRAEDFANTNTSLSHPAKRDLAVSYFIGLHADETKAQAILAGDRHMTIVRNGPTYSSEKAGGAIRVSEVSAWSDAWPPERHGIAVRCGNVVLADGSVEQMTTEKLQQQLATATNAYGTNINLFLFPQ